MLPNSQAVCEMVPFVATRQNSDSKICFGEPMPLAAKTSTDTVTTKVTKWFMANSDVAFARSAEAIHESDRLNVFNHSFSATGGAQAGLDIFKTAAQTTLGQLPHHFGTGHRRMVATIDRLTRKKNH